MINALECTPSEAADLILTYHDQKKAIFLSGRPGVGKSDIIYQVAKKLGARVIDERLSQKTAADLGGLPALDHATGRTRFYPPAFLPDDSQPTILFLDELNMADDQTQGAALGLILERRIGDYKLPDNCFIVAAGNRPEDGAQQFIPALNDRFIHLVVEPNAKDWLNWATENGIDRTVMAFIHVHPQYLVPTPEMIQADHAVMPSPRSWHRVSDILKVPAKRRTKELAVSGIIGDAVAAQFFLVADELANMASIETILKSRADDFHKVIPASINGLYALAYALVSACSTTTASAVLSVLGALPRLATTSPSHMGLPMADIQALGMTMVLEKLLELGIDCNDHPSFITFDEMRNAESATQGAAAGTAETPAATPAEPVGASAFVEQQAAA